MFTFASDLYGRVIAELTREPPLLPLAKPQPNRELGDRLRQLSPDNLFPGHTPRDADMAACCLAGLWLLAGHLEESHRISQEIATPSGSYWHGLMHRLEADFSNSKYWFRRVGRHPVFPGLHADAVKLAAVQSLDPHAAFLKSASDWDPFAFVDLCQRCVEGGSSAEHLCREIQRREWELLFDHCCRAAVAAN